MSEIQKLEIFYVRHAQPDVGNDEGRGHNDYCLSELGFKQAELLGERLKDYEFDAVFSSPLLRCVCTAACAVSRMKERPTIELLPEIIEKGTSVGYVGQSLNDLSRYYDKLTYCPDIVWGESDRCFDSLGEQAALDRCWAIHLYLRKRFGFGKRILIIAHGSIGNSFLHSGVGILKEEDDQFCNTISHTSVSKYKYTSDGRERISFVNDISHLRPLMPHYELDV